MKASLLVSRFESLQQDFARLDKKYGNDWTEWQDVRDSMMHVAHTIEGEAASNALHSAITGGRKDRIKKARARLKAWIKKDRELYG